MRRLHERPIDFAYDYRMRCDCGAAVRVTAETYFREQTVNARVPCNSCGDEVHFGPAVTLVRDELDPALDDEQMTRFAWYHTSTWSDWPSVHHRERTEPGVRHIATMLGIDPDLAAENASSKAIHVGTYEAAVENMLRRMSDQADGDSAFHLYRVAIQIDPGRINPGYRDENGDDAAQLSIARLDDDGLDAVRYVNVHESPGSLSLALRPQCLTGVQRISIPIPELAVPLTPSITLALQHLENSHRRLAGELEQVTPVDARERRGLELQALTTPESTKPAWLEVDAQMNEIWKEVDELLIPALLQSVQPVVGEAFVSAMHDSRRAVDRSPVAFADRFAATASLLTRAPEVIEQTSRRRTSCVRDAIGVDSDRIR